MLDILNLMKAYTGETQARFRYKLYANIAKEEGYEQIAAIFEKTALQETEHAEIFFDLLKKYNTTGVVNVNASYPVKEGTTLENLKSAADGENEEWTTLYKQFADEAENEDVKTAFTLIAKIEKNHERRFNKLIKNIDKDEVFTKHCPVIWECVNCGNIHVSKSALDICPVCGFTKAYTEMEANNY